MDGFYYGLEASLLALALAIGLGAFTIPIVDRDRTAVTLPMLTVWVPQAGR